MCGIIGCCASSSIKDILINGLERLEYRGYDSSGISYIENGKIITYKSVGKLINLKNKTKDININSSIGIGHNRWATHGEPSLENAHPHISNNKKISLVHNGIIENYLEIKDILLEQNTSFYGKTDTEVIVKYIEYIYKGNPLDSLLTLNKVLKGTYALCIIFLDHPNKIFFLKKGSPLLIGKGKEEMYLSSDIFSLQNYTNLFLYIKDDQYGYISNSTYQVFEDGNYINTNLEKYSSKQIVEKLTTYNSYLEKEIYESKDVIKNIITKHINNSKIDFSKYKISKVIDNIENIVLLGCGSSYHSALIGKYIFEDLCKIPSSTYIASEFPYTPIIKKTNTLYILISQSGETADLISCLPLLDNFKLGIINVKNSSLSLKMDDNFFLEAGSEISVATTKAYLGQLTFLYLLGIYIANNKKLISKEYYLSLIQELESIPNKIKQILDNHQEIKDFSNIIKNYKNVFFIGRNLDYLTCLEGSLKLKEVTYIHSEAIPSGELKHGTISLIDQDVYTIALLSSNLRNKTKSNIKEIESRKGKVFTISTNDSNYNIPSTLEIFYPLLQIVPLQLLSLYTAENKKLDIDKPRNLAKSVTVE